MKINSLFPVLLVFSIGLGSLAPIPSQASHPHHSASGPFGLGVVLGDPTGLSAKYRLSSTDAVDLGLAYAFDSHLVIFADYLYHLPGVFGSPNAFVAALTPYLGIGAVFFTANARTRGGGAGLGMRIPLGLEWRPSHPPIGVFLELVPGIGLIPGTFGFINGGIGARFYF